jgi:hypothetical protein
MLGVAPGPFRGWAGARQCERRAAEDGIAAGGDAQRRLIELMLRRRAVNECEVFTAPDNQNIQLLYSSYLRLTCVTLNWVMTF